MIPRAIWSSLKKGDNQEPEEEEARPGAEVERKRGGTEEREKLVSATSLDLSKGEAKPVKDDLSRSLDKEEAQSRGLSVEDWLQTKKEEKVSEWLQKSVEPAESTRKKWVHSLEVNENPERVAKSSDELIDDIFAAVKKGDIRMKKESSSEEVIDLSSGGEEGDTRSRERSEDRRRRKKKEKKEKEKEKERDRERERSRRKKKKKKRSDDSGDEEEERHEDERKKKRMSEESEEEEQLRQIALQSIKLEPLTDSSATETKCFNPSLLKFASAASPKAGSSRTASPKMDSPKGEEKKASEDEPEIEDVGEDGEADKESPPANEVQQPNTYNANVILPPGVTEEELKKKSDQLLDDLFIYMQREKNKIEEEERIKGNDDGKADNEGKEAKVVEERDEKRSEGRGGKDTEKENKETDKDRKGSRRSDQRRSGSRGRRRRSGSRSRRRSGSRGRKSADRDRKSRKRSRSSRRRNGSRSGRRTGSKKRSDSKKRGSSKSRKRSKSGSKSRKRSKSGSKSRKRAKSGSKSGKRSKSKSGSAGRRSRSQDLLVAAERFQSSRKGKHRMKQHLMDQTRLLKIARESIGGSQDTLRLLSMQCMEIARAGLEEEARAEEGCDEEEEEESSEEEADLHDVVLNIYATPSMMRISKSNSNYKNILNNELEKYGQLGSVAGFWMSPQNYDKAYEKTIGDGMGGKKTALYRPTGTSMLAIGYEGHTEYSKVYLPTTIRIQTQWPEKWEKKGLVKTIFARASLYGDINIQDTNPHGRQHPPSAFPTASGTAPQSMQESSTALVVFNPGQEPKGPYNPFSKEAKEWEKEKRRQALLEALLPGGSCHPGSRRLEIENHHVPFNPFSKEAKEKERSLKEAEKDAKRKEKEAKRRKKDKEDMELLEPEPKKKGKPPQFNPFQEGFRPSSYGYGEVRWTDEGPLDVSRLGDRFKPEQSTKYKL
jgi:hypothetical protein